MLFLKSSIIPVLSMATLAIIGHSPGIIGGSPPCMVSASFPGSGSQTSGTASPSSSSAGGIQKKISLLESLAENFALGFCVVPVEG